MSVTLTMATPTAWSGSEIGERVLVAGPVRGQPTLLGMPSIPAKICDESPLAGLQLS